MPCYCLCKYGIRLKNFIIILLRIILWLIILISSLFISYNVFSLDRKGQLYFRPRADIERNGYVVFLVVFTSLMGFIIEFYMIFGLILQRPHYFRIWFIYTMICGILSTLIAVNFVASLFKFHDKFKIDDNWFFDGMCIISHMTFFFIPEFMLSPHMTPMFLGILIIFHIALPMLHFGSYFAVKKQFHYIVRQNFLLSSAPPALLLSSDNSNSQSRITEGEHRLLTENRHLCINCKHKEDSKGTYRRAENNFLLPESTV